MNSSVRNIMSKEYREIKTIWLAMLTGGSACLLIWNIISLFALVPSLGNKIPYWTAVSIIVLVYAVIISSQSFVREIETGTYFALRRFPVSCRTVSKGKCLADLISVAALALAVGLFAGITALIFRNGEQENFLPIIGSFIIPVPEALCIGFFISARCRHEYTALLLTLLLLFCWDTAVQYATVFFCEKFLALSLGSVLLESTVPVMAGKLISLLIFLPGIFHTDCWFKIHDEYNPQMPALFKNHIFSSNLIPANRPAAGEFAGLLWVGWRQSQMKILVPFHFIMGFFLVLLIQLLFSKGSDYSLDSRLPKLILPIWFLYACFMALEIFHADMRQKNSVLTTRFQVTPWKFWLSRLLLFIFPVVLVSLFSVVLMQIRTMYYSIYSYGDSLNWRHDFFMDSWKSFWMGDFFFSQQGTNIYELLFWYVLLILVIFMVSVIVFAASFCRRRIMIMAMSLILFLPLFIYFIVKMTFFQYASNLILVLWFIFAFFCLSCRMIAQRLRSRPLTPFGPAFLILILLPVFVTSFWSVECETAVFPQYQAIFPKEDHLGDKPFDPQNKEDAEAIRLRENISIAFYHRISPSFEYVDNGRNISRLVRDLSSLEEGWEKYLDLFRNSENACGPYSVEVEWVIVRSIIEYNGSYTPNEVVRAAALLERISNTRPSQVEQERRKYRFYVRLLAKEKEVKDNDSIAYYFLVDTPCRKKLYQKMLWNEFQSRADVALLEEPFFRDDNNISMKTFLRLLYKQRRLVESGFFPHGEQHCSIPHYNQYWYFQTETLRRMLLVQMAVLRYYDKYNKYPDHWEELQRAGFLGKMPKSLIPDEDLIISAPFDPENEEGKKIMKKIASKDYERVKNARFFMVTGNKSLNYRFQIDYNSALHDRSFRLKNEECISGRNWHFSKVPVIYDPRIQVALYLKGPTGRTDQKDSPDGR